MSSEKDIIIRKNASKLSKSFFWSFLVKNKWRYILGFLSVLFTTAAQVGQSRILGYIVDLFLIENTMPQKETFLFYCGVFIFLVVIVSIGRFLWRRILARQTHYVSAILKSKVWDSVRFFRDEDLKTTFTKGPLMNLATSDVGMARFIFGFTLVGVSDMLLLGIMSLVAMVSVSPELSIYTILALIIIPPIIKYLSTLETERYVLAQEYLSSFNDLASQVVASVRLSRLTQTGDFWQKRMYQSADEYRLLRLKAANTSIQFIPGMGTASILSYAIIFFVGTRFVISGQMSIGDFIAFQGFVVLFQDPLLELGFIISDFKKSFTSLDRLMSIFHHEKEPFFDLDSTKDEKESSYAIKVEGLSFSYANSSSPIIEDFSLSVNKGKRVGITGKIGSGKSTLVRILSGLERNYKGVIEIDGKTFDEYSHHELRSMISIVSQRPFLFASSIYENIKMDQELSEDQAVDLLKTVSLYEDVQGFEDGIHTKLGEWGINLSGGQKQRLTIARSLAKNPKILFFDDCLSAVDTVTEDRILENLNQNLKDTTLVWVAHRKSTLKYCDQVIELGGAIEH